MAMKFIVPLPDTPYYLWQALVQMASFRELGYEEDAHYLVIYFNDRPSDLLLRLWESDEVRASLHLYPDTREDRSYSASMAPWLLGQFFEQFPDLESKTFNFLDPDCIFTHPMDFSPYEQDDGCWYGSATGSYSGADYIRSKGERLFIEICEIAGITPEQVLAHDHNSIGAQSFIRGAGANFWFNVARKSTLVYRHMVDTSDKYNPGGVGPIQAWCAYLYVQQYETILHGYTPIADDRLAFHWANSNAAEWDDRAYFHNAGVVVENGRDFCKITWQSSPFRKEITVSPESASWQYLQLIRRTEEMFPDLIWD